MVLGFVSIHVHGGGKLAQVAGAADAARVFLCLAQSGQEQRRENRNDRNDDEQFNECEGAMRFNPGTESRMPTSRH